MRWTATVPWAPESLNVQLRTHWAARKRQHAIPAAKAAAVLVAEGRIPRATGPRRVTIERRGPRVLDLDNCAGSYKCLVDALVRLGVLTDDSPATGNVIEYRQISGDRATTVTVEDAG